MIRVVLLNPILLAIVAGVGYALCRTIGVDPHGREMLGAVVVGLLAGSAASVVLIRPASSATALNRSALVSTAVHLLVMILGGVVVVTVCPNRIAAVVWILAAYWATLAAVAVSAVAIVKSSAGQVG